MFGCLRSIHDEARGREAAANAIANAARSRSPAPSNTELRAVPQDAYAADDSTSHNKGGRVDPFRALSTAEAYLSTVADGIRMTVAEAHMEDEASRGTMLPAAVEAAVRVLDRAAYTIDKGLLTQLSLATPTVGPTSECREQCCGCNQTIVVIQEMLPRLYATTLIVKGLLSGPSKACNDAIMSQKQKEGREYFMTLAQLPRLRSLWEQLERKRCPITPRAWVSLGFVLGNALRTSDVQAPPACNTCMRDAVQGYRNFTKRVRNGNAASGWIHHSFSPLLRAEAGRANMRTRSPSPPPNLRQGGKNSFSFSVRVNSDSARVRSPLPPRSTTAVAAQAQEARTVCPQARALTAPQSDGTHNGSSILRQTTLRLCVGEKTDCSAPDQCTHRDSKGGRSPPLQPLISEEPQRGTSSGPNSFTFSQELSGGDTRVPAPQSRPFSGCGLDSAQDEGGGRGGGDDGARLTPRGGSRFDFSYGRKSTSHCTGNRRGAVAAATGTSQTPSADPRANGGVGHHTSSSSDSRNTVITPGFVTASEQLLRDIKSGRAAAAHSSYLSNRSPALGLRRNGFQPPFQQQQQQQQQQHNQSQGWTGNGDARLREAVGTAPSTPFREVTHTILNLNPQQQQSSSSTDFAGAASAHGKKTASGHATDKGDDDDASAYPSSLLKVDGSVPDILKPLDPKLVAQVAMEILENGAGSQRTTWEDIVGLEHAKSSVEEAIVWPLRRPDLFVGLRDPPRGLLLFGPPGTGKTMIARAIANHAQCTFLNISASSLMSKWIGDGEKLVRCLFAVAVVKQPSVIFIDEIDSLLSMRGEGELDSVRRIKTEFLVHLDGVATNSCDRVLLIGATNRPNDLDEAARRRMEKRLYIPLPDITARRQLVERLLSTLQCREANSMDADHTGERSGVDAGATRLAHKAHSMSTEDFASVAAMTAGYSGADLRLLCREAAMGPLREMTSRQLSEVTSKDLRPINWRDFQQALRRIKTSVGVSEVQRYVEWNRRYGSFATDSVDDEGCGNSSLQQ